MALCQALNNSLCLAVGHGLTVTAQLASGRLQNFTAVSPTLTQESWLPGRPQSTCSRNDTKEHVTNWTVMSKNVIFKLISAGQSLLAFQVSAYTFN